MNLNHPRRIVNRKYREWIAAQPCWVFSSRSSMPITPCILPIDPHHVIPDGGGKTGSKVDDRRCVPLCRTHHNEAGRRDHFEEKHNVDLEQAILWLNRRYDTLFPPKEKRERQASARVQHLLVMCACSKVHKLTPAKCGTITEAEIRYWCPFKKAWQSASFRRTA